MKARVKAGWIEAEPEIVEEDVSDEVETENSEA